MQYEELIKKSEVFEELVSQMCNPCPLQETYLQMLEIIKNIAEEQEKKQ